MHFAINFTFNYINFGRALGSSTKVKDCRLVMQKRNSGESNISCKTSVNSVFGLIVSNEVCLTGQDVRSYYVVKEAR